VGLGLKEFVSQYAVVSLWLGVSLTITRVLGRREAWFRRALPWAVAAAAVAFAVIEGGTALREWRSTARLPAAAAATPDILVVVLDTVRADHLSSYGYPRATSPTLDRLAREGVRFEHAFATSSYTLPSHASMLTGLYPDAHEVEWDTSHTLRPTYPTLPAVLQKHGYRTGAFSANTFYFSREHGFGRGFLHFEEYFHSLEDCVLRTAYGQIATRLVRGRFGWEDLPGRKLAEEVNAELLAWVGSDASRPVFVVANYMDAHDPYLPPEPYRSRFSRSASPGGLISSNVHVPARLSPDDLQSEIDAYDGAIAYMDAQFDALLRGLGERRQGRELMVIVTSDHGEEFGEHGNFTHGSSLYRELLEVPLVVWQPGTVPAATRVARPVSNVGIPATIMTIVQPLDRTFAGPLQPFWSSAPPVQWDYPRAELQRKPWAPRREPVSQGSLRSVVGPDLHYIESDAPRREAFAWRQDPMEQSNRADDPALAEAIEELKRRLP
jgi:arylsulfatase A-like enzyme